MPIAQTYPGELIVPETQARELLNESLNAPSFTLSRRQIYDLEMLLNGAFSPLEGFMLEADYESVCESMRLKNGSLWPIPIVLDVSEDRAAGLSRGMLVSLRNRQGIVLATMEIGDIWQPDRTQEAKQVYGTTSKAHPGVAYLLERTNPVYIGGKISGLRLPAHYAFSKYRHTPKDLNQIFGEKPAQKVFAFISKSAPHRVHQELINSILQIPGAHLLLHAISGLSSPGDIDYHTRVRATLRFLDSHPSENITLALLPLAMRMAGPREALWHGVIEKNCGCSHIVIGEQYASPADNTEFYKPYEAQALLAEYSNEIGIGMHAAKKKVYYHDLKAYQDAPETEDTRVSDVSGDALKKRLRRGDELPNWLVSSGVAKELQRSFPPRLKRGFTVFFTGLSAAGKSTIASAFKAKLLEWDPRPVTLLDGDIIRTVLSNELGFSKEHRSLNVRRVGYVASEITKNRGVALCALIAPYKADREHNRELISSYGGYFEVHVATPLEVCEKRDPKGLYAKARKGMLKEFTGIDDPYESPLNPEISINSGEMDIEQSVELIFERIKADGYL